MACLNLLITDEHFRFLVYFRERNIIDARWTCQKFSGPLSMPDGRAKSFPDLYRCPMDVPKVFQASIDARWTCQKFSRPLSMPDGRAKSFPCLYRCPMDVQKVFQASIDARWIRPHPQKAYPQDPPRPSLKGGRLKGGRAKRRESWDFASVMLYNIPRTVATEPKSSSRL